jgi:hypothetical protein
MSKKRTVRPEQKSAEYQAAARAYTSRKRRNQVLAWGAGIIVVMGLAFIAYDAYQQSQLLDTVTTAQYSAGLHQVGRITHAENPPMGGVHNAAWQNCGIYDLPVHNEHAVHSLEHGAVWITYRPDLPADQVQALRTFAADDFMLLSPYPGLPAPVVASAWNRQIRLEGAADPRLPAFIATYKNNPSNTPEFGASCFGAIRTTAAVDTLGSPAAGLGR